MNAPVVTVVMPVFNAAPYLRSAIESILGQTLAELEFLIYDDGSTDGSVEIAREYATRDPRIRFTAGSHRGYVAWLNEGITAARAEFIARMDADDLSFPERLAEQVALLRREPSVVAVGTDCLSIDEEGDPLGVYPHEVDPVRLAEELMGGALGVMAHPTVMMRRTVVIAVGSYDPRYEPTEDLDLWFRLSRVGQLTNIPRPLLQYRHHDRSVSYAQPERQRRWVDEIVNRARAQAGLPPLSRSVWVAGPEDRTGLYLMWARWAVGAGYLASARKHARRAIRVSPFRLSAWALLGLALLPAPLTAGMVGLYRGIRPRTKGSRA